MFRELYGLNKFNRTSGGQQFSKHPQATVLLSTKNCIRFTSKNFAINFKSSAEWDHFGFFCWLYFSSTEFLAQPVFFCQQGFCFFHLFYFLFLNVTYVHTSCTQLTKHAPKTKMHNPFTPHFNIHHIHSFNYHQKLQLNELFFNFQQNHSHL